jgi:ABC-type nitrate/sulfonate/bicarbonate transport system substrate-binding protein
LTLRIQSLQFLNQQKIKNIKIIKIAFTTPSYSLPFLTAYNKGLFDKNGIKINLHQIFSLEDITNSKYDVILGVPFDFFLKKYIYIKMKIFSATLSTINKPATFMLTSLATNDIKKIAIPDIPNVKSLVNYIKNKHITNDDVKIVLARENIIPLLLIAGKVDAIYISEPLASFLIGSNLAKPYIEGILEKYLVSPYCHTVDIISEEFTRNYPNLSKQFLKVIKNTISFTNNNHNESMQLLTEYLNGFPYDYLGNCNLFTYSFIDDKLKNYLQKNINALLESKYIPLYSYPIGKIMIDRNLY